MTPLFRHYVANDFVAFAERVFGKVGRTLFALYTTRYLWALRAEPSSFFFFLLFCYIHLPTAGSPRIILPLSRRRCFFDFPNKCILITKLVRTPSPPLRSTIRLKAHHLYRRRSLVPRSLCPRRAHIVFTLQRKYNLSAGARWNVIRETNFQETPNASRHFVCLRKHNTRAFKFYCCRLVAAVCASVHSNGQYVLSLCACVCMFVYARVLIVRRNSNLSALLITLYTPYITIYGRIA